MRGKLKMKMKINRIILKELRNQKCWSQDHLSQVSGLSLRTVQRIEAKGVASQDSIKSLASVYEVDCQLFLHNPDCEEGKIANVSTNECIETPLPDIGNEPNLELLADKDGSSDSTRSNKDALSRATNQPLRKKYIFGAVMIIAANAFGLWGIFSAYYSARIDHETFSLLKGIVSINMIACVVWHFYRGFKKGVFSLSELD
jgi:transcriptional regulator with XRE-family HTH domain